MSEETITGANKEILRKQLERLQKEYERTAKRLQRAERREAARKHVQDTVSSQKRLLEVNASARTEQSSSSSSDPLSKQSPCSENGKVRFDLPERADAPPVSASPRKQSPSQRLRSKRSRLRLRTRAREPDTDESQEKAENATVQRGSPDDGNLNREGDWEQGETRKDVRVNTDADALEIPPASQSEAEMCPAHRVADSQSQVGSCPGSVQLPVTVLMQNSERPARTTESEPDVFHSCTLVEGLPFPVEYYVRTTRRMASSRSPVNISAVVLAQLSKGWRGRKAGKTRDGSLVPEDGGPGRRRGARGRGKCQEEPLRQPQASLPTPEPRSNTGPDFKHLPDSQLYLDCPLLKDSDVYPMFRKRRRSSDGTRPLPSLTSLAQALRDRDFQNLGRLLTILDIKDFHLPDEEFGLLKLERLCAPSPNVEPALRRSLRKRRDGGSSGTWRIESERFTPCATSLESSFPLSQLTCTGHLKAETRDSDQSEEPVDCPDSETLSWTPIEKDDEPEDQELTHKDETNTSPQPEVKTSQIGLMLNLSVSLATQIDPNPTFVSLGTTPGCLAPPSSSDLASRQLSSPERLALCAAKESETPEKGSAAKTEESTEEKNENLIMQAEGSERICDTSNDDEIQTSVTPEANNTEDSGNCLIGSEIGSQGCNDGDRIYLESNSSEQGRQTKAGCQTWAVSDTPESEVHEVSVRPELELENCDVSAEGVEASQELARGARKDQEVSPEGLKASQELARGARKDQVSAEGLKASQEPERDARKDQEVSAEGLKASQELARGSRKDHDVSAEGLKASQELARGSRRDHKVSTEGLKASQEPERDARKDHKVSTEGLKASQEPERDDRKDHKVSTEGLKASQEPDRDDRKDHKVSTEGLKASQEPEKDARKDHEVSAEGLKASQEPEKDDRRDHKVSAEGLKASQEPEKDARKDHEVSAEGLKASQEPEKDDRKDHKVSAEGLKASQEPEKDARKDHEVSAEGLKASQELARGSRRDHKVSTEGLKASQEPERDARKDHDVSAEGLKASQELARGSRRDHKVSTEGLKASQEPERDDRKDQEVSAEDLKASQEPERDARKDHEVSAEGLKASQELARGSRRDHKVSTEGLKASQEPERDARKDQEVSAEGLKASQEPEKDARKDHEVSTEGLKASQEPERDARKDHDMSAEGLKASQELARGSRRDHKVSTEGLKASQEPEKDARKDQEVSAEGLKASQELARVARKDHEVSAEGLKASQEPEKDARKDQEVSAEGLKASQELARVARKDQEVSAEGLKASQELARVARKDHEVSAEGLKASQELARGSRRDHEVSTEGLKASQEPERDARKDHDVSAEGLKASQELARGSRRDHEVSAEGLKASQELARGARKDQVSAEGLKASQEPERDDRKDQEVSEEGLKASQEPERDDRKDQEVSEEGLKASQEPERDDRKDQEVSAEGLKASQEPTRDARKDHKVSEEGVEASQESVRDARKDHEVQVQGSDASDHVDADGKSFEQDQQTESGGQLEATGNKPETAEIFGPVNKVLVKPEVDSRSDVRAVSGSGCKTGAAESAMGDTPKVVETSGPTSGVHQEELRDQSRRIPAAGENGSRTDASTETKSAFYSQTNRQAVEDQLPSVYTDDDNGLAKESCSVAENGSQTDAAPKTESNFCSQSNRQAVGDPLASVPEDNDNGLAKDPRSISDTSRLPDASTNQREASAETVPAAGTPDSDVRSCGSLRKTHTFKAPGSGGVLDVCVVRWPAQGWCVGVAGERSVCVWAREAGVRRWNPVHTWTFEQSLISLQDVPHSPGLLCVALGRMQMAEIRILCSGSLSQAVLCVEALQAVLAVPGCRVSCCSAPGPQQRVQVYTLSQDGRAASSLRLVSTKHSVRTLAVVERQSDALIGWTEQKTLLLWSMRSGQLLQTVGVAGGVACLRGYSYRGALCSLLQREGARMHESGSDLFALVAANPLTGKSIRLTSFTHPMTGAHRLIDSDACGSSLVGVFHSGRLVVWDLRGGVACVYVNDLAEGCRLARWAGPNTLLAGYLNGDVNVLQFTPAGDV